MASWSQVHWTTFDEYYGPFTIVPCGLPTVLQYYARNKIAGLIFAVLAKIYPPLKFHAVRYVDVIMGNNLIRWAQTKQYYKLTTVNRENFAVKIFS